MSNPLRVVQQLSNTIFLRLPKKPETGKQRVITGLRRESFADAVAGVMQIQKIFGDHIPPDALQSWESQSPGKGLLQLEFSNQYFTLDVRPEEECRPLSIVVDPYLILTKLCPDHYTTADNEVLYYERRAASDR